MLEPQALRQLFDDARSHNGWLASTVDDEQLQRLYDLFKWGPTAFNGSPARFVFLRSAPAKERLRPALSPANVDKCMTAPVVAIVGYDTRFHERLPALFPHNPAVQGLFEGESKAALAEQTAFRNGSLQGAYMMLAARALGLDCGPMSGFNAGAVDAEFFAGTAVKSNFLCALGQGDPGRLFPRSPRLSFAEACTVL